MWTITNSMNRLLGFKAPPVGAPMILHKQGFHSLMPAAMTAYNYDKKFTNPNFVNPGNPSVLRSVQVSQSVTPSTGKPQTSPPVEPKDAAPVEHPPVQHPRAGAENSRAPVDREASKIGAKNSTGQAEDVAPPKSTAGMSSNTRKRTRRNRRGRRKQRDGHNAPGKHCKNPEKQAKHSKHVEHEQIIKEEMEIEQEVVGSPCEVIVDPLVESHCKSYPQLCDYIHVMPQKLDKEAAQSQVDYHNHRNLKQPDGVQGESNRGHEATYQDPVIICFNVQRQHPEHSHQSNLHDDDDGNCIDTYYKPTCKPPRPDLSQNQSDDDDDGNCVDTVFYQHSPMLPSNPSRYQSDDDDDDGNCVDTVFYDYPLPLKDSSPGPRGSLGNVFRLQLIENVPENNFKVRCTNNSANQCRFDFSAEEESDDDDDDGNCVDGVPYNAPLKLRPIQIEGKDEVDNVCFMGNAKRPLRVRQISVADSEDSFIVFDDGTDEECDFSEGGCEEEEDEDDNAVELDENVESEDESSESESKSSCSVVPTKKVRFADDSNLCDVHPMVKWAYAYQAARKGPWEEYARDRERFKRRICETGRILNAVFLPTHRKHVFDERFAKFDGVPLKA